MPFTTLNTFSEATPAFQKKLKQLKALLQELAKRDLPQLLVISINTEIAAVNELQGTNKKNNRALYKHQQHILKAVEKELKLVPKNYYRNLWMVLGMTAFGLPMGVALSSSLSNMAFIGIGLPVGMAIGLAVGTNMDQKAAREGRQLTFDAEEK